jgi:hypothetical protein
MSTCVCVCVCCVFEWRDLEIGNKIPDLSYTLCQQADCSAPRLVMPLFGYVGDSEVTRRMEGL